MPDFGASGRVYTPDEDRRTRPGKNTHPSRNQTLIPLLSLSGRGKIEIRDIEVLKN
jgi:hypothetical protein